MTSKTLEILDNSLKYSLWTFLIVLILTLALVFAFKSQRAGRSAAQSAFRAAILSLIVAAAAFCVLAFTPLSPIVNFASVHDLDETPLRLTALTYERTYEGFSLQGEVWNQSPAALANIQAEIQVWGQEGKQLDRITVFVEPRELAPRQSGAFTVEYSKNSPFLYGYDVSFVSQDGKVIPHVKGFDVR